MENEPEGYSKKEAIKLMRSGIRMTHRFFTPDEFIIIVNDDIIKDENGYEFPMEEFFRYRKEEYWEFEWFIY